MSHSPVPGWSTGRALPPGASYDGSPKLSPQPQQSKLDRPTTPTLLSPISSTPPRIGSPGPSSLGTPLGSFLGPMMAVEQQPRPSSTKSLSQEILVTSEHAPSPPDSSAQRDPSELPSDSTARAQAGTSTVGPIRAQAQDRQPERSPAHRNSFLEPIGGGAKGKARQMAEDDLNPGPGPGPAPSAGRSSVYAPDDGRPQRSNSGPAPQDMAGVGVRPSYAPQSVQPGQIMRPVPQPSTSFRPPSGQPPPHLVQQPEICVECMMRDRDMADVDVTGAGVWERESDAEYEEIMRSEEDFYAGNSGASEESASVRHGSTLRTGSREGGSRESLGRSSVGPAVSHAGAPVVRRRLGRGNPLTSPNLKLWTNMNPPASAHRWKTLQVYLATQRQILDLERQAREAGQLDRVRPPQPLSGTLSNGRGRSQSSALPSQTVDLAEEDRTARARAKSHARPIEQLSLHPQAANASRTSTGSLLSPQAYAPGVRDSLHQANASSATLASPTASVRSYGYGDQPWLAGSPSARRFSSPQMPKEELATVPPPASPTPAPRSAGLGGLGFFGRSSSDLRSVNSPRSLSPGASLAPSEDKRGSVWSKFRQSASQSVLSFAPSGSMMDMHLGLSMDKHRSQQEQLFPYDAASASDTQLGLGRPPLGRGDRGRVSSAQGTQSVAYPATLPDELDRSQAEEGKPKKKGLKKLLGKMFGGDKKTSSSSGAKNGSSTGYYDYPRSHHQHDYADYPLAPPPPISALVNEPNYQQRSSSSSSVDSFQGPHTPPPGGQPSLNARRGSGGVPGNNYEYSYPRVGAPADRQSILTMGSYASTRSKNPQRAQAAGRTAKSRPSFESLQDANGPAVNQRTSSPELYSNTEQGAHAQTADAAEVLEHAIDPSQSRPSSQMSPNPGLNGVRKEKLLPFLPGSYTNGSALESGVPAQKGDAGMYAIPNAHKSSSAFNPQTNQRGSTTDSNRARARSVYSLNAPRPSFQTTSSAGRGDWDSIAGGSTTSRKSKFGRGKLLGMWGKKSPEGSPGEWEGEGEAPLGVRY